MTTYERMDMTIDYYDFKEEVLKIIEMVLDHELSKDGAVEQIINLAERYKR